MTTKEKRERNRLWRVTNRSHVRRYRRRQYLANLEREQHAAREWQRKNAERVAFNAAKARCTNPQHRNWNNYGGRGIKFLFDSFEQFIAHIGTRPAGRSLDRIDNSGHYEPGNVRWATLEEQCRPGGKRINHVALSQNARLLHAKYRQEFVTWTKKGNKASARWASLHPSEHKTNSGKGGISGTHTRWHVARGRSSPDCIYCLAGGSPRQI